MLSEWLATKDGLQPNDPLFPVSGKFPGGTERKTHKMMQLDLARAKEMWIEEVDERDATERTRRQQSDFLEYCNADGLYADFHSNRHLFITSLERVGISPKMAQTLARHSDVRLTLGVYTHVGVHDQTAAISSLPAPPVRRHDEASVSMAQTGTDGPQITPRKVPTVVPRGARNGAIQLASPAYEAASICTETGDEEATEDEEPCRPKSKNTWHVTHRSALAGAWLHRSAGGQKASIPERGSNL